jgi:hypothetical protein
MTKGLRLTLWILSSLAVLWTVITLVGFLAMGGMGGGCAMMSGGMMRDSTMMGGMMGNSGMMGGMHQGGMMGGGWMAGMMLHMTLTWLVMLGLVGVFVYLILSARRGA